jgi:cytochrome c oxidase subunit 3
MVDQPYSTAPQQREAATMGMFVFLGSEIMLFGGLFAAALALRLAHSREIVEASKHLHVWIGAINTAVLLTSSALVALGVEAARARKARPAALLLAGAALLGVAFLGIKAYEYASEYAEGLLPGDGGPTRLFMDLYLISTGLHAVHVTVGVLLLAGVATALQRRWLGLPRRPIVVETAGLFWHLVDAIWVFLYPALYLIR